MSNSSSFSPSPLIFQVAYLNRDNFSTSMLSFKENRPDSFRETCQWLKFPLNRLRAQSRVSPAVELLPLASGPACLRIAFSPCDFWIRETEKSQQEAQLHDRYMMMMLMMMMINPCQC